MGRWRRIRPLPPGIWLGRRLWRLWWLLAIRCMGPLAELLLRTLPLLRAEDAGNTGRQKGRLPGALSGRRIGAGGGPPPSSAALRPRPVRRGGVLFVGLDVGRGETVLLNYLVFRGLAAHLAEGVGFEPTMGLHPWRFSRP